MSEEGSAVLMAGPMVREMWTRSNYTFIREYDSTLYVGMVQGVSNSQYIGIGTKSRKASKTAKTRLRRAKYEISIH